MDTRLDQALEFVNYRQTLNNQLHKLKIKTEGLLIFAQNGGKFTITQQLICFVDYVVRNGYTETVLIDDNGSPTRINDTIEFLKTISGRYFDVTNQYCAETHAIKKLRNVKSILDIKD